MLGQLVRSFWDNLTANSPPLGTAGSSHGAAPGDVVVNRIASGDLIDDQKLLELSAEPERPLFPWLRAESRLAPLVLLLAALAPAFVAQSHHVSLNDVLWGEKALECVAAESLSEFVDPSIRDQDVPFRWQPPLITWMTAFLQQAVGPRRLSSLYVVPALSAAGLILSAVLFARSWGGARAALATGILIACHPQLVQVSPRSAPWVAGLGLGMLGLWGFVRHWNESRRVFSWRLLIAALAGGTCLLAGGPLAFGLLLVTAIYIVWWGVRRRFATSTWTVRGVLWGRREIFNSWALALAIAALAGGWWLLLMLMRHGTPFLVSWLSGPAATNSPEIPSAPEISLHDRLDLLSAPLYLGLSLVGLLRIVSDDRQREDDSGWRHRRLLLVWGGVGIVLWMAGGTLILGTPDGAVAWRAFLIVPLGMLAAVGLMDIADRRLPYAIAFGILTATLVWGVLQGTWGISRENLVTEFSSILPRLVAAVGLTLTAWVVFVWGRDSRNRQAKVLTGLIVLVMCVHAVAGLRGISSKSEMDSIGFGLHEVQESLRSLGGVRHVTCVAQESQTMPNESPTVPASTSAADQPVPPMLRWLLRSHWPHAAITTSASWEQALSKTGAESRDSSDAEAVPHPRSDGSPHQNSGARAEAFDSSQLIVVWGARGRLQIPPVPSPARRHGSVFGIAGLDVAVFVVPTPP